MGARNKLYYFGPYLLYLSVLDPAYLIVSRCNPTYIAGLYYLLPDEGLREPPPVEPLRLPPLGLPALPPGFE